MNYKLMHKTNKIIKDGKYYPLGATLTAKGINFAIYSQYAEEIYLLLFDEPDGMPSDIIKLENKTKNIWFVFVEGTKEGQLYGYKIKGQYDPLKGLRFNENKLLIDPYARALSHKFYNKDNLLLSYNALSDDKDLSIDSRDNTEIVPKGIVINNDFDWQNDANPEIPFENTIIYETHVKGFTAKASIKNKGTYLGFVDKIPYLKELGINAVELLPVHEFYVDDFLIKKNLTNFWGYNTICFFAPEQSYSSKSFPGCQVNEFKTLVRELHKNNIEIILDVVYNHTGEGNELGPTMCFKGIDNASYYCLDNSSRYYLNYTGCGNSMNLANTPVIRLVLDSLRYWVEVMHVDGFRFDLASVLGKEEGMFHKFSAFFDAISQDPALNKIKLIAEPWDIGDYEVGNFPIDWSEWNGKFRDNLRKFGKGDSAQVRELGNRLTGSADLYSDDGRSAFNSINFITCHDGFTLKDLVSYNSKHNEANLENNSDGSNDNNSWNCGFEGETKDPKIISLRKKLIKNFAFYLLLSAGTPMILGGDEICRTQKGNNNAYCQDNDISWFNWDFLKSNNDIYVFFKKLIYFRNMHTVLHRKKFYTGKDLNANNVIDISWFDKNLNQLNWNDPAVKTICYQIDGSEEKSIYGDYLLYIILNSDFQEQNIVLPELNQKKWYRKIDTSLNSEEDILDDGKEVLLKTQDNYLINPRSSVVLLGK